MPESYAVSDTNSQDNTSKAEAVLYTCVTRELSLGTACYTISSNTHKNYMHRPTYIHTYITINKIQKERTKSNAIIIIIIIIIQ